MTTLSQADAYDQIADRWLDQHFNQEDGIAQHRRALSFLPDSERGSALSVGCGCSTRFNALVRQRGFILEGLDCSSRMIELARASDPSVTLHQADICEWIPPRRYNFISAWDSIWHVPLREQRSVLLKLMAALQPEGVFLFSAGGTDKPGEHTNTYMGPEVYYSTLGVPGILESIREAGFVCRHLELDQHPGDHLCVIAQKAD